MQKKLLQSGLKSGFNGLMEFLIAETVFLTLWVVTRKRAGGIDLVIWTKCIILQNTHQQLHDIL